MAACVRGALERSKLVSRLRSGFAVSNSGVSFGGGPKKAIPEFGEHAEKVPCILRFLISGT